MYLIRHAEETADNGPTLVGPRQVERVAVTVAVRAVVSRLSGKIWH